MKTVKKVSRPRTVRVVFELTFPNRGSWDGHWSGEKDGHYIFKQYPPVWFEKNKDKVIGSWYYNFGDGWGASISSRVIDGDESRTLHRRNAGFSGYNWMVTSIENIGKIEYEWHKFLK